ncbi:DNA gyrase subunit A, partial [Neisseria sp. P0004.S010]|uniref:DNA gyrase subunit A n=1 Tax=Neisseria sp. P0004.S010 TaxID=3436674 RepID=UPI003F7E75DD
PPPPPTAPPPRPPRIAVGKATELPPHKWNEVTQAAIAWLKKPTLETAALRQYIPAPDFAGGGQIITPAKTGAGIYCIR